MRCAVRTHRVDPTQPRGSRRDPDQWAAGYHAARADQRGRGIPTGGGGGGNRSGCALFTLLTITALCLIGGFL